MTNRRGPLRLSLVLSAIVSSLASILVFATPASADSYREYWNVHLGRDYYLVARDGVDKAKLSWLLTTWQVQQISDSPAGNDRVFIKKNGRCLDSHAGNVGNAVWLIPCNGGTYQIWEVFYPASGKRVFKSWGSWTEQGRHLCMTSSSSDLTVVNLATCNVNATRQQWYSSQSG